MDLLILFVIGIIASVFLNGLVIIVILKKGHALNMLDCSIVSLAFSDFLQAGCAYSLELYAYFNQSVRTKDFCKASGFGVSFLALTSINHLVGISLERFIILRSPFKARSFFGRRLNALFIIIPSWLYAFLCALFPLIGWSSYRRLKAGYFSCQMDMNSRDDNAASYLWFLLVSCFLVPLIVIVVCAVCSFYEIQRIANSTIKLGVKGKASEKKRQTDEKNITFTIIGMIVTYLIAWSPYAICVFVFSIDGTVGDTMLTFSGIFGKLSTAFNPIVYSLGAKSFRMRCRKLLGFPKESNNATYSMTRFSVTGRNRSYSKSVAATTIETTMFLHGKAPLAIKDSSDYSRLVDDKEKEETRETKKDSYKTYSSEYIHTSILRKEILLV